MTQMKKSIISLAIAAAVATPVAVMADATVYGKLHLDFVSQDDGSDSGLFVDSNDSRLGFKGSEDLGNGLSALYQVEMDLDQGGTGAIALQNGLRNTYIGLSSSSLGAVIVGKHDTPYKITGRKLDMFGDTKADSRQIIDKFAGGLDDRNDNTLLYKMPTMGGFNLMAAYVTPDAIDDAGTTHNENAADAFSINADWGNDMFWIAGAYTHTAKHFGGYNNGNIDGYRIGGNFKMAGFKVNALYSSEKQEASDLVAETKWNNYVLGASWSTGPHTIKGQYVEGEEDTGGNTEVKAVYALGYDYAVSKKTTVYALYTSRDDDNYTGSLWNGVAANGDNPSAVGVGMVVKF
jgi:predicted porin